MNLPRGEGERKKRKIMMQITSAKEHAKVVRNEGVEGPEGACPFSSDSSIRCRNACARTGRWQTSQYHQNKVEIIENGSG